MADPTYLDSDTVRFGDLEIKLMNGRDSEALSQRDDIYYMMKSLPYIDAYKQVREALGPSEVTGKAGNILEVGVFRGGSAPFLHRFFDAERVACVDILKDSVPLTRYSLETKSVVKLHYGVDQGDTAEMRQIATNSFSGPIDLIVDDASHMYGPTKATFEATFPFLRPGGVYVMEDWAWSHDAAAQRTDHFWAHKESLTRLVFELVAAYGTSSSLLASIGFGPGLMWVVKGRRPIPPGDFRLEDHLNLRGRSLGHP